MGEKNSIKLCLKRTLFCIFTIGLLTACVESKDVGAGEDAGSEMPVDIEETVVIDRDDEVDKKPIDDTDSISGGGSDWDPKPEDKNLENGEAFINQSDILIMESYPPQFAITVSGTLPNPCHMLRVEVNEPDQENQIHVLIYSVVDPAEICVQVLEDFEANVMLGTPPPGNYQILLNGDEIGEIGYE